MIRLERAFGCRCTCVRRAVLLCVYSLDKTRSTYIRYHRGNTLARGNRTGETGRRLVLSHSLQPTIVRDNQRG